MKDDISHANGLQQISNYISRWFLFGNWQSGSWWKRAIWIDCLNHVANLKHNPSLQQQKLLSTHETKKLEAQYFFFYASNYTSNLAFIMICVQDDRSLRCWGGL